MRILALEFSSPQRSVAVITATAGGAVNNETEVVESVGSSSKPLATVEEALRSGGVEREQIECVAVGMGPGSYTGIRTSIALAQGWQLARAVKLFGISSVEAIVAEAHTQGLTGLLATVIDAQRGEFYLAVYEVGPGGWREREALRLASAAEVQACCGAGAIPIGPEVARNFPQGRLVFPRAAVVGRLAMGRKDSVSGETLEPIYLRQTTFVKAAPIRSAYQPDAGSAER